jgi:choline dehydrogenase
LVLLLPLPLTAPTQHPMSRGYVQINSTSTFDSPIIQPGYLTHPADIQVLVKAFQFARNLSQTAPFSDYVLSELSPGTAVQTDAEWETWIRGVVSTEYRQFSSSCSLPSSLLTFPLPRRPRRYLFDASRG